MIEETVLFVGRIFTKHMVANTAETCTACLTRDVIKKKMKIIPIGINNQPDLG